MCSGAKTTPLLIQSCFRTACDDGLIWGCTHTIEGYSALNSSLDTFMC
ncbi:unnamed protein product [Periconia digitata]|uniref:Uncharacterized protein n=1 Tax=Periconia digitata TaxID=1303443 RepID=A0A9W4UHX9_9PLEO|nr:unnamed protein product [Periconia digitata]